MSTKIWAAVRIPASRLNEYIALCRAHSLDKFYQEADVLFNFMDFKKIVRDCRASPYLKKTTGRIIRWRAVESMVEAYKKGSASSQRSLFAVDSGLNIWLNGEYAYIIPVETSLPECDWSEDYHYQDQTDRPEDISEEEWESRSKKWDEVCLNDWNSTRLYHEIVSFSADGYFNSLWMLELHFGLHPSVQGNNSTWKPSRKTVKTLGRK